MLDGPTVVQTLAGCGVSHVVWIPDSELGRWEAALVSASAPQLIRATREGEAIALAAGLLIGGKSPIVAIQCTGLFEAGDSLRNVVHDLKLPLFLIVGVRSYKAYLRQATVDTCPIFTEPILRAWQMNYRWLDEQDAATGLAGFYQECRMSSRAGTLLLPE